MVKLKPCPFCGGRAVLEKIGWPHLVSCIKCGARMISIKWEKDGEQEAVKKWNQRVKQDG